MNLFSLILRDPDATSRLFETVLDLPNGKRTLSRLARTCRAVSDPALNVLWRDLDSLVPIIGLFPNQNLKKARRPGLGFSKSPAEEDWRNVLKYSDKVRRLTYDESANNVAASVFPVLNQYCPQSQLFPRLTELSWKADTPSGLERCTLFLSSEIRNLSLEVGAKFPQISHFLSGVTARTKLTSLSFVSPTPLPISFTNLLSQQETLESVYLAAPGALSSSVGRWAAFLPRLKSLQLDLSQRSSIAVEGFFDDLRTDVRSGETTPSDTDSESGVFSDDEGDFTEIRKSARRGFAMVPSADIFPQLKKLHLTGEIGNIAIFLRHMIDSPLASLELVIDDPADNADWQDFCVILCEDFAETLQSLRITANPRLTDYNRSAKGESSSRRLSLEYLSSLPHLTKLDIDLPESTAFTDADIENLSKACPNLEVVRLCPQARFSPGREPHLTLDSLAYLTHNCRHLHTLAIVLNARYGTADVLTSRSYSSRALLRLQVGHSWIGEPLHTSIFLSHVAPYLESIKFFQEKNRPGFMEANAKGWQAVSEILPHLQGVRLVERFTAAQIDKISPRKVNKAIDATPRSISRPVNAVPRHSDAGAQFSPTLVNQIIQALPKLVSAEVDAVPLMYDASAATLIITHEQGIDALPNTACIAIDATPATNSASVETSPIVEAGEMPSPAPAPVSAPAQIIQEETRSQPRSLPQARTPAPATRSKPPTRNPLMALLMALLKFLLLPSRILKGLRPKRKLAKTTVESKEKSPASGTEKIAA